MQTSKSTGASSFEVFLKFCCKAIITWRFIICFRILWFHLSFTISSKDISASLKLKFSLDIFFMLEILLRNSSTLKKVLKFFLPSSSCLMLAQSLAPFSCLIMSILYVFNYGFDFRFEIFFSHKFCSLFFGLEILIFFWVVEILEKVLAFFLELDLMFPNQKLAEEVVFGVFNKESNFFSWNCNIFLSGGVLRKYLRILFKTIFGVFPPLTCWRVGFFCIFNKRRSLCSWG